jgi:hypothetical protein
VPNREEEFAECSAAQRSLRERKRNTQSEELLQPGTRRRGVVACGAMLNATLRKKVDESGNDQRVGEFDEKRTRNENHEQCPRCQVRVLDEC